MNLFSTGFGWFLKSLTSSREVSNGDGIPVGIGFLAYPENMKFGVRVSAGNIRNEIGWVKRIWRPSALQSLKS
jgi:hypothetical protein